MKQMTNKNLRIRLRTCNEINELINKGIEEQWTSHEFFVNIYCPIFIKRTYIKQVELYLRGWYDAGMHIVWHTLMNPITMDNDVTWKSTGKLFCKSHKG